MIAAVYMLLHIHMCITGRASVALHTVMYFKSKPTEEHAYVLSVGKGKLTVLVPRFGIEGTVSSSTTYIIKVHTTVVFYILCFVRKL
jgi:S1 domain